MEDSAIFIFHPQLRGVAMLVFKRPVSCYRPDSCATEAHIATKGSQRPNAKSSRRSRRCVRLTPCGKKRSSRGQLRRSPIQIRVKSCRKRKEDLGELSSNRQPPGASYRSTRASLRHVSLSCRHRVRHLHHRPCLFTRQRSSRCPTYRAACDAPR